MTGLVFVDSNILIYAHDAEAGAKQQMAKAHIKELWENTRGRLSTQVLQEFYVVVTRKILKPVPAAVAREIVRDYGTWVHSHTTPDTIVRASELSEIWRISFWDSLIVASAEEARASTLLSEDFSHGQAIAGIQILNPFAGP
jgi:predicted nucleic acid-binding protein